MTVGFHSPLPPAPTGVADYAAALLAALRRHGTVIPHASRASVHLYHIGNNQLHRDIYLRALAEPGVVVLHDAVLQHFFLGFFDEDAYCEEFVYNYGEWLHPLARTLYRERRQSAASPRYFRYPMLKRLAERSLALIVHNPGAAALVAAHAPGARVIEIPHLFTPPPPLPEYAIVRERVALGFAPGDCVFGVFGHLRESKRIFTILAALAELRRAGVAAGLVLAGDCVSPEFARALSACAGGLSWVRRFPHLPERDWYRLAAATDVGINLRWPSAGETSGIAIRLMGLGKPVIMSRTPENACFPEPVCLQVDTGLPERRMLKEIAAWLARSPSVRQRLGRAAAAHIHTCHNPSTIAARFWDILKHAAARRLSAGHPADPHHTPPDPPRTGARCSGV